MKIGCIDTKEKVFIIAELSANHSGNIKIAKDTNKVGKLYWHQLVAPGYGLVDNRDGVVRKTPAFYKFKQLIN